MEKVTVIISVYKNVGSLKMILNALRKQSVLADEIIISEDGESPEMKEFVSTLTDNNIVHLTQEDLGWRKNLALNRAIIKAMGEYLIFIDGDVVPHRHFIKGHLDLRERKKVCCGKRASLGEGFSQKIVNKELDIENLYDNYFFNFFKLHKDDIKHYEDGIYSSLLNKLTASRYIRHIIGCNFSCYKDDFLSINGFNEDFVHPAEGEDVDITWRFRSNGIEMKSCRYVANIYHIWHKKNFGAVEGTINRKILDRNREKNEYICLNGIKKLQPGETL